MAVFDVVRAEAIARALHFGQTDKAGDPYIEHVERVVASVFSDECKAVAWLHDVVEDTQVSCAALLAAGIPTVVVDAVRVLTKPYGEPYLKYIDSIKASGNPLAFVVKVADLRDHLRANCPESLRERYMAALYLLAVAPEATK
jgi:hypothetical protein